VYFALLASVPALSLKTQLLIRRNILDIVNLHEHILNELYRVVPNSDNGPSCSTDKQGSTYQRRHVRWRSLDVVPESGTTRAFHVSRRSVDAIQLNNTSQALGADPRTAADVAHIFDKLVRLSNANSVMLVVADADR
jgi:hypothetical protein